MSIQQTNKRALTVSEIAISGIMATLLFVAQVSLNFIPNVEVVSLLIIVFTVVFGKKTLYAIYVFAFLEGMMYGFGIWWVMYLYVWTILYVAAYFLRHNKNPLVWAITSGFFGLIFGLLCSIPYAVAGGIGAGIAWWTSGLM
ncbi:MAG: hypothetical protein ACK5LL_08050, partial [Suipraeoptans sp.]